MAIELDNITSGYSTGLINNNFQEIEEELNQNVLRRDGVGPGEANEMRVPLDMNSNPILNLPAPAFENQAARLKDVQNAIAGISEANLTKFTPYGNIGAENVQGAIQELADGTGQSVTTSTGNQTLEEALEDRVNKIEGALQKLSVAELLSNTTLTYTLGMSETVAEGDIVHTVLEGFSFEVAPTGATDQAIETAGGVKLYALPVGDTLYSTHFGLIDVVGFPDCTDTIQRLIETSASRNLKAVILAGEYGLTSTEPGAALIAPSNLDLTLEDSAEFRRIGIRGGLMNNYSVGASVPNRTANGNIRISGGIWNGQGSVLGSNSIINFAQAENITFEKALVTDCQNGHHIEINGVKNATIQDCRFTKFIDAGGRAFSEAIQLDYMGGESLFPGLDPSSYDGMPCENIMLRRLYFFDCGRAIGSHSWDGGATHWIDGVIIEDIEAEACQLEFIRPQGWRNFSITRFKCKGEGAGTNIPLRIEDCDDFYVGFGDIEDFGNRGIWVRRDQNSTMKNWTVEHVKVKNVGGEVAGIEVNGVGRGTLRGCLVEGAIGWGINVTSSSDVIVVDSDIISASNQMLRLFNNTNVVARENKIATGGGDRCIDIQQGMDQRAIENTITGLVSGKIGISITNSAGRALARGNRISGTAGLGIQVSNTVSGAWLDSNDLRGMSGGTAINNDAGGATIQTANQT